MKKAALMTLFAAVTLAGCATGPRQYDEKHSEAYNIAQAGGLSQGIKDKTVPASQLNSLSELALDGGWAASGFFNPQLGMSNWQTFGFNLLGAAVEPETHSARSSLMAWMPKDMAATSLEARDALVATLKSAIAETMNEFGAESRPGYQVTYKFFPYYSHQAYFEIQIINPGWNCSDSTAKEDKEKRCWVVAAIQEPKEQAAAPDFIAGAAGPRWGFASNHANKYQRFNLSMGKETRAPEADITAALSKNLPEWVYLYTAPNKVAIKGSEEKLKFPYVLHKGEPKLFLIPE